MAQSELSVKTYSRQDSLRGSITAERVWWDVQHYDLYVSVNPEDSTLKGTNIIRYQVIDGGTVLQIDLQHPLKITRASQNDVELPIEHEGSAHFITTRKSQIPGEIYELRIEYEGKPKVAINPPWDGGVTWQKDKKGNSFIATACQGIGASVWWPCKDHAYDEPDEGIVLRINVPEKLKAVGNGRLKEVNDGAGNTKTFIWEVKNSINNYGVNLNVGDYTHFSDTYHGENGKLDLDFWVLEYNEKRAKEHFKDVYRSLEAFEYWFGPYPFYEDSYKLVEVPYLGMEHQSSVTYGNGYMNGYKGQDLSQTGWGLKWDYLIVHETAHEWFANNITYSDPADMWIHESFACYAEGLFIEYFYGKEAGGAYLKGMRQRIDNQGTIIGDYDVNKRGEDLYDKGANVLHTLRQWVNDDALWRQILRGLNEDFYHQVVTTNEVEAYIAQKSGLELSAFFDQYLRDRRVPVLEYVINQDIISFRWTNCIPEFNMPVKVNFNDIPVEISPVASWRSAKLPQQDIRIDVDEDYYVYAHEIVLNKPE